MKQLYIILYKYSKHRLFVIGVGVGVGGPEEGIEAVYRIRGGTGELEEKEDKEDVEAEDQSKKMFREGSRRSSRRCRGLEEKEDKEKVDN